MDGELKFERRAAKSGAARSMVMFLHGYGANGADLLGLADPLADHLPDTVFVAPNAPEPCRNNPFGFQWFPIPRLDGSTPDEMTDGFARAENGLNAFVDRCLTAEGVSADRLVLVGFSQGSMMALQIAPRRTEAMAGVVAFSGRLLNPERLMSEVVVRPPVLLVHGDQDEMVPFDEMGLAGNALVAAGMETFGHVMKGTGHGIAPDGLSVALAFLKDRIG
ncbi:alpha/beta hydrolase [Falsirhodobacter halotolerans]|uniref:alpha/beta hydrolase n=1 Tax=Falsirhodobacter halotolerans TaxID=1146892 RepID=UPI001FD4D675|nr:dienelactone hydrolase family protein [Falsirhodobacter halotolerans]MCJ8139628.1 alpha/beta hydrolase [Falsirhodobacter halotolerans]